VSYSRYRLRHEKPTTAATQTQLRVTITKWVNPLLAVLVLQPRIFLKEARVANDEQWLTTESIHAFTKSPAQNLVERGIRVNCVAPGPVWTPLNPAERSEDETRKFGGSTPLGRPAQPEEIAPAYVYFASNIKSS